MGCTFVAHIQIPHHIGVSTSCCICNLKGRIGGDFVKFSLGIYQDQIDLANYQMQALQAQIKPHFLYNTLDVIKWMILEGRYQDGIWMVNSLSKYLRMSINKVSAFVTLRQELELGHIYLDMMQKRCF